VRGVSSSRIREAIDTGEPVMVQDPELLLGAHATEALRDRPCSVLVAPVCDPSSREVLAVAVRPELRHRERVRRDRPRLHRGVRARSRARAGGRAVSGGSEPRRATQVLLGGATLSPELESAAAHRLGALALVVAAVSAVMGCLDR
jgi:hypothetical protein